MLKAAISSEIQQELLKVKEVYADDIDADKLAMQLTLLKQQVSSEGLPVKDDVRLPDIISCITKTPNYLVNLSEVLKLAELILVAAATNATSKRTFSAKTGINLPAYINVSKPPQSSSFAP